MLKNLQVESPALCQGEITGLADLNQTFDHQFKLTYMSILQLYILVSKLWAKVCCIRRKRENDVVRLTLPPLDCREWSAGFLLNDCPWLSASAKIRRSRSKSNWNRLLGTSPPWGDNWTCHSWYHIDWTRKKNEVSSRNKRRDILHHCHIRGNLVSYLNEDGKLINHVLVEQLGRLVWYWLWCLFLLQTCTPHVNNPSEKTRGE